MQQLDASTSPTTRTEFAAAFRELSFADPAAQLLCAPSGRVVEYNPAASRLLPGLVHGGNVGDCVARDASVLLELLRRCSGTRARLPLAIHVATDGGGTCRLRGEGMRVGEGQDDAQALILIKLYLPREDRVRFSALTGKIAELNADIHLRRREQAALKAALEEKEVLYRELQHRVKNNLQVVEALMRLQHRREKDPVVRRRLMETTSRISALSTVQNLLYRTHRADYIDVHALLTSVCGNIGQTAGSPRIRLRVCVESVDIDTDRATVLALLANEIVLNAYKHAFPDEREGTIELDFHVEEDEAGRMGVLAVKDDGIGAMPPRDSDLSGSGMLLIERLSQQIDGTFTMSAENGLCVVVRFPMR